MFSVTIEHESDAIVNLNRKCEMKIPDHVYTASGQLIPSDDLGRTLMHEHVFVLNSEIEQNYPERWDEETRMIDAVEKLESLYEHGIQTIVDLTVVGLGRNVERVAEIASRVRPNIIVATGLYTFDELPLFFKHRGPGLLMDGSDPLVDFFIRDITEGIAETGIRAGILKCATDIKGITPDVERVLRATAIAHKETGAPISTHTHAATKRGLDQLSIFSEEGVNLEKVVIGHSGDTTDLDYLQQLLDAGVFLGMDRFGYDLALPFEERVSTVAELCHRGYAPQIVLSHDAACYTHNFEIDVKAELLPKWHYEHISTEVLPALRNKGVTEAQIEQMLVTNPATILG